MHTGESDGCSEFLLIEIKNPVRTVREASPYMVHLVGLDGGREGLGLALHADQVLLNQQLGGFQAFPHICYLLTYHVFFNIIDPYNQ